MKIHNEWLLSCIIAQIQQYREMTTRMMMSVDSRQEQVSPCLLENGNHKLAMNECRQGSRGWKFSPFVT